MKLLNSLLASLLAGLMLASGAQAQVYTTTFENGARVKGGLTIVDGGLTISSGSLSAGALAVSSLTSTGAISGTTITGSGALTGASLTVSTPIINANIGNGAKRQVLQYVVNGGNATAASTTYRALLIPGRACIVKAVNLGTAIVPIGGTNTVKVLKASSSGNTLLSAASVDPTTLTVNTVASQTLTSTSADLSLTATQGVYVEYAAGIQTTAANGFGIQVEIEPSDF